jgi:hypothetical protein
MIRKRYIEKLSDLKDQKLIKVITGVRRAGKSTLMLQFQDHLKANDPSVTIISINLDDPTMRSIAEIGWRSLYEFITQQIKPNVQHYVFLDEIQNVVDFERLLEGLFILNHVDLYVTGSNAYLLSSELATLLTGRSFEINLLPFSFAEYLDYTGDKTNIEQQFSKYLAVGGFPEALNLAMVNEMYATQYLQQVYKSIFENDISKRHKIYSEESYQQVVRFLTDSIGSSVSANNIANTLTSAGKKIDNKSVTRYISTLVESYLFYEAKRYDIKGKMLLKTQEKYYLVDTGLRHALLGRELTADIGHLLENVVYLELLRREYAVWIGKVDSREVDFVVRGKDGYTKYIQVSHTVMNPETLARELTPFDKVGDHNEKILLTMDWQTGSHNGVKQMNVIDWMLNK